MPEIGGLVFDDLSQVPDMPVDGKHVEVGVDVIPMAEVLLGIPLHVHYQCV